MECRHCGYQLWALRARHCPECGQPFAPSEYEFAPNSVRFCCPDCQQAYYGVGERGHLVPVAFTCVRCNRPVHMDQMVLFPADGLDDDATRPERMPWLERAARGRVKAWFQTVGMALVKPGRLMQMTPPEGGQAPCWWFAIITVAIAVGIGAGPFLLFMLWIASSFGGRSELALMIGVSLGMFAGALCSQLVTIAIWGALAHGILLMTGGTARGIGRTYQAMCYGSGCLAAGAIPCVGVYLMSPLCIWWSVSAILMLVAGQGVRGWRATAAVLAPPLSLATLGFLLIWASGPFPVRPAFPVTTMPTTAASPANAGSIASAVQRYADENGGEAPAHGLELVRLGELSPAMLVSRHSARTPSGVRIADTNLKDFASLPEVRAREIVRSYAQAVGTSPAHRLGDYVFTYGGIDLSAEYPEVWLVIEAHDPDLPIGLPTDLVAGMADGSIRIIASAGVGAALAEQNALRSRLGLPTIPDPRAVGHTLLPVSRRAAEKELE